MTDDRRDPPNQGTELEVLMGFLDYHRQTLAMKCADLTPQQLTTRSVEPSTLSLLGLVRHLAEVERGWFRNSLMGEGVPPLFYSDASPDGDFDDVDPATVTQADVDQAFDAWRAEIANGDALVAGAESVEVIGLGGREKRSLRWILVHLIEEYCRHNGHADLLRERVDGRTGE
ncbi:MULTISPECIES: DinB family protein [Actinoalloteichus]|uniref:DUF664 family protein n=1 Tax=Actinoalloteichus fjordicus TaxID=1612552 RepID=A0AAC9PUF9_9PSEU|nr:MULTISPECIES: DinB family protein [Actinoalloteichus]APU17045.1 putative DUF664 family protein [Actinoalloteichus fjordicus]APU23126.1 putative DUF664 family protein [Actinoalloteichus sp. GBA129-24]